jgi:PAT family beta-lactamase induction signal transducer AmpG
MAESERAKAGGIMFGAQILGISAATAMGGALLERVGFPGAMLVCAIVPGMVLLYGTIIREREGERRLPWSDGQSHPHNLSIQAEAWWPLLRGGTKAVLAPLSLVLLPILLFRALPAGAGEVFHPIMASETAGWSTSDYTNVTSLSGLVAGLLGMVLGGWAIDAIGAQRSVIILMLLFAGAMAGMGLAQPYWGEPGVLTAYLAVDTFFATFVAIAMIPICMRMCSPAVAATQFTIYMAVANFGRPLGASLAAATAGAGQPAMMYFSLAAIWLGAVGLLLAVRFPAGEARLHDTAEVLPQGEGLSPVRD